MILLKLFLLLACFGCIGRLARRYFSSSNKEGAEQQLLDLVAAIGMLSLLYFVMAAEGLFHTRFLFLGAGFLALMMRAPEVREYGWPIRSLHVRDLFFLALNSLAIALVAMILFRVTPPYEAILYGDDGSVYSAAAAQLAHSGKLSYTDALVQEMTPAQKEAVFRNRYREDWTGPLVRFAGGVRLTDPGTGLVHFAFYQLTNVWLAFAIKIFGLFQYSAWLSLVSALTLVVLFFLGRRIGGTAVGVLLPVLVLFFYSQQYFSRFPVSEPLAQLLFLSGLLSLVQVMQDLPEPQPAELRRTGILWGASFLARVDCIYLVAVFLVITLISVPSFARNRKQWLPLLRILLVCALGAAFYQFDAGEYISLFTNSENLKSNIVTDLALDLVTGASRWVHFNPLISRATLLLVGSLILFVPIRKSDAPKRRVLHPYAAAAITAIVAMLLLAPITGFPPRPSYFARQVRWFFPYIPPVVLILFAAGPLFVALKQFRRKEIQVVVIFFALACAVYLFRPLILPAQPWSMRRFVPMLIPLFFLLTLSGWNLAAGIFGNEKWRAIVVYTAGAACALLFYSKSAYLFENPLYANLIAQWDVLAARIPPNALVLVPDSIAGLHFELALRYRSNIDTLLLPLSDTSGRRFNTTIREYLAQQEARRPVLALTFLGPDSISELWKQCWPRKFADIPISLVFVPRADRFSYPAGPETSAMRVVLYSLSPGQPGLKEKQAISYDDASATFLHFHEKENGFRWSRETSTITDFIFPAGGKPVDVSLHLGPLPPGFQPDRPQVSVMINYNVPAEFAGYTDHVLHFRLKEGSTQQITSVTMKTATFKETNSSARELGISFAGLAFDFPTSSSN